MNFLFRRSSAPVAKAGKVVVFGCDTVVGQPLSLLLKLNPHVEELVCCGTGTVDGMPSAGIVADLAHVDTLSHVRAVPPVTTTNAIEAGSSLAEEAAWVEAVRDAQVVLLCAGTSFDPLRTDRDVVLRATTPTAHRVMAAIAAAHSPAVMGIVSSPVNALTPFCAEVLKRAGRFDPRKLFGVTNLDVLRTRKMVAEVLDMNPFDVTVPVVGGRGGVTACPLIAKTGLRIPLEQIMRITEQVQSYGVPMHEAMESGGADALSTEVAPPVALGQAYAACDFTVSLLKALRGDIGIVECAMVESTMRTEVPFFSSRVELGREGVQRIFPMGLLTAYENDLIEVAVPALAADGQAGLDAAAAALK